MAFLFFKERKKGLDFKTKFSKLALITETKAKKVVRNFTSQEKHVKKQTHNIYKDNGNY